jgi:hypothetical protein
MPVEAFAVPSQEDCALHSLADGQIDRPSGSGRERDGNHLGVPSVEPRDSAQATRNCRPSPPTRFEISSDTRHRLGTQ